MAKLSRQKTNQNYKISYNLNDPDPPRAHEIYAARIIADYFKSDVVFIRKTIGNTPDLKILETNQVYELKSPLGNGKRTMANNLRKAAHQSKNVILDLSRCKMNNENALARIREFLKSGDSNIKKLLIIKKNKKILDFPTKTR